MRRNKSSKDSYVALHYRSQIEMKISRNFESKLIGSKCLSSYPKSSASLSYEHNYGMLHKNQNKAQP